MTPSERYDTTGPVGDLVLGALDRTFGPRAWGDDLPAVAFVTALADVVLPVAVGVVVWRLLRGRS